jgi:transcriptional regulator with XRE-family HTH domain
MRTLMTLNEIRERKGFTQKQVADRLEINLVTYNRKEKEPTSFSVKQMQIICDYLNISLMDQLKVFEWEGYCSRNQAVVDRAERDSEKWNALLDKCSEMITDFLIREEKYMLLKDAFLAVYNSTEIAYNADLKPEDFVGSQSKALKMFLPFFELGLKKADFKSKNYRDSRAMQIQKELKAAKTSSA